VQQTAEDRIAKGRAKAFREYEEAQLPGEREKVVKEWWPRILPLILKKLKKKKLTGAEKFLIMQKFAREHPKVNEEARRRISWQFHA
jgi:hypothetical protein